jgi:hypothetical protein
MILLGLFLIFLSIYLLSSFSTSRRNQKLVKEQMELQRRIYDIYQQCLYESNQRRLQAGQISLYIEEQDVKE